jgi:small subunit ribosomal protein S21
VFENPVRKWQRKEVNRILPFVKVRENEPFDRAFRRFTKSCEKSGLMAEIRRRQRYEKPSEIRKRMENAARRKLRKMRYLENR